MIKIVTKSQDRFRQAVEIAVQAHQGQVDRNGVPYICHSIAVAQKCSFYTAKCVAMLHDVLEDTEVTAQDLFKMGVEEYIIECVEKLTHDPKVPYLDYIQSIIDTRDANIISVKYADLCDNLDPTRGGMNEKKVPLYRKARRMMEEALCFI